ncbi:hypothetical protein G7Y89_g7674 [Cudoniella acicularis]|uniref:2EXR domain-containing protein n=1 Tax=Cudoniella acicularis TaxID=354080 RepID=A0A8H4RKB8_9HELO|nr:hypothetical protein G7Y89_g7674 [Cudoniella acicularis]
MESTPQVLVPADYLASLVNSIENIRTDVEKLWETNASLSAEVQHLKKISPCSRPSFQRFPKLPLEIRTLIWEMALNIPRITILSHLAMTRSEVNTIMESCQEARRRALEMRIPYLRLVYPHNTIHRKFRSGRNYINVETDTLYLSHHAYFPHNIDILCGQCGDTIFPKWAEFGSLCQHNIQVNRVAIPFKEWVDPDENKGTPVAPELAVGTADILRHLNSVRELLIVVGDSHTSGGYVPNRDIAFIPPRKQPYEMLENFNYEGDKPEDLILSLNLQAMMKSWDVMGMRLEMILQHFKEKRCESRKRYMEVDGLTAEELDDWPHFANLEDWEVPRVRYVEAVSETWRKDWLTPPLHWS